MRRAFIVGVLVALGAPTTAHAQDLTVPAFGAFRSVLAQGEGDQLNALEFAQYQATEKPPASFTSQQPLYVDVMPKAATLELADLDRFYKSTDRKSVV